MAGKESGWNSVYAPSGLTATSPTGEEWKERYVGEDGAGVSGGEAMGEVGAGCGTGGYADCVMCWILIDCYEAGTGFDGLCAVCAAEDEACRDEGDGALGEVVYY